MTIKPCNHCHLAKGCGIRLEKLKAVRGLGLTTMTFRCSLQKEDLKAGTRITVDFPHVWDGEMTRDYPDDPAQPITEKGTIQAIIVRLKTNGKLIVWIPPEEPLRLWSMAQQKETRFGVAWPNWIHIVGGEPEPHCEKCGTPKRAESDFYCDKCNPDPNEVLYGF